MWSNNNSKYFLRAFIASSLIFFSSCAQPKTMRPHVDAADIRAEEKIQKQLADEAAEQGGLKKAWRNRPQMHKQFENAAGRVEDAGGDICRKMGIPAKKRGCYFYFEISRDRDLNARADGKSVYLNGGLLRFLENEDEVAMVLAHELAHNIMGHTDMKRQNANIGTMLGVAVGAIAASEGAPRGGYDRSGNAAGLLTHSIAFEEEADYVGLYIAAKAGYNISKAPHLWRRLSIEFPDNIYNGANHPSNAERFVAMKATIAEIEAKRKHHQPLVPSFDVDKNLTDN